MVSNMLLCYKFKALDSFSISGEINGGYIGDSQSLSGSRKSLGPMQPVMMMPHPMGPPPPPMQMPPQMGPEDGYSEYGGQQQRNGGGGSPPYGRGPYGQPGQPNIQNFQL
jgi:hypothetical protein